MPSFTLLSHYFHTTLISRPAACQLRKYIILKSKFWQKEPKGLFADIDLGFCAGVCGASAFLMHPDSRTTPMTKLKAAAFIAGTAMERLAETRIKCAGEVDRIRRSAMELVARSLVISIDTRKIGAYLVSVVVGSRKRMNLLLTIVFGVVGLVLSYGFFIPPELSMFRFIAAIGVMVGYRMGQLVGRLVRPSPKRFLILSVGAVLCFYFAFAYAEMIQMDSANSSDIVNLGALLGLCFLSLGFLLPFTRVLVPNEIEILWSRAIEYFARLFRG